MESTSLFSSFTQLSHCVIGPLPEIVQQLEHDNMLDRVNIQKASLPQPIASNLEQVFVDARPNAVLLEKSAKVEMDFISAQQSAWGLPGVDPTQKYYESEKRWPTYHESKRLASTPTYLCSAVDGETWIRSFMQDCDDIVQMRQEHIHPMNASTGQREPLTACRSREKPKECKHGFYKDRLLHPRTRLICHGLADDLGLKSAGKRNSVGSLEPPRNSASTNVTIPALAVASGDSIGRSK